MRRVVSLYGSSVGKKIAMGLSGLILFGFVIVHMLGNLKAFQPHDGVGPHPLDQYGAFLREFGYPVVPEYGTVWVIRIALLVALGIHMIAAYQLWRQSRSARTVGYGKAKSEVFSYASLTMRWGGVTIAVFVVYHLLHMTTGTVHPEFEYGSVYQNLVIGFQSPLIVGVYLIAVAALSAHLYHGVWSVFTTLGVQNPRIQRLRRPVAAAFAGGLLLGYAVVPLAVMAGILRPY